MGSRPPSYTSSASLSSLTNTRDDIRSMADAMLRASLSGSVSSTSSISSASIASSASTAPPSYRRARSSITEARSGAPTLSTLSRHLSARPSPSASLVKNLQITGSVSSPSIESVGLVEKRAVASRSKRETGSVVNSSLSRITAGESKQRVRQLQHAVKLANARYSPHDSAGLFKRACSTDILFLIDTTNSMQDYIDAAKNQVKSIVEDIKATFLNETEVRVAVVSYKDHYHKDKSVQYLDFVSSPAQVSSFLDGLTTGWGEDNPEDVLGGIRQVVNASWRLQTRCLIHIADAPPHGGILHDMGEAADNYFEHGSEPHSLTYTPLLRRLIQLNINYALLRVNATTDRMALRFSQLYAAAGAEVRLLRSNRYFSQINNEGARASSSLCSGSSNKRSAELQFEEMPLGISFKMLQHLVLRTVTRSASLTATRLTTSSSYSEGAVGFGGGKKSTKPVKHLTAIRENEDDDGGADVSFLEKAGPQWGIPSWFNQTLVLEGFCPDVGVHTASTLNEMMALDDNIKLSVTQLTLHKRSMPFAEGAVRLACYARTAASTNRFVVKSFKQDGIGIEHIVEDMRVQALCKAFALEFNSLLRAKFTIDFVVTTGLQDKSGTASGNGCISLEPFIDGAYIKYNSNAGFVKEAELDDPLNDAAQAFSHFTFERSWGSFLVTDLQGVGHNLTDPAIQTKDPERFKLGSTNLHSEGFKFFFATHVCNSVCCRLELRSNKEMFNSEIWDFREEWPTMDSTVCCSNKLCRRIVLLAKAQKSVKFPGYHWCDSCWPQLQSTTVQCLCDEPGPEHEFEVSQFFHESQGQAAPNKCPEHLESDTTAFSPATSCGNLWSRMQAANKKASIQGRAW